MNRMAATGFFAIVAVAGLIAYRVAEPRHLVSDENDSPAELTTAAGIAVMVQQLTPTPTKYASSTPTRTPRPPTATAYPTVGAASPVPGLYLVPKWTPSPGGTVEAVHAPPCVTVTPERYTDIYCEVSA